MKRMKYNNKIIKRIIDNDYGLITVENGFIFCSYFRLSQSAFDQYYQIDFYSSSADLLFNLINQHNYLSQCISLSHALYLGKEIYKAELSISLSQTYIQA